MIETIPYSLQMSNHTIEEFKSREEYLGELNDRELTREQYKQVYNEARQKMCEKPEVHGNFSNKLKLEMEILAQSDP